MEVVCIVKCLVHCFVILSSFEIGRETSIVLELIIMPKKSIS